jgi:hypothetical protein
MSKQATAKPKEIIEEINKLRENPSLYAKKVEEYSTYFNDKIFKLPNLNIKIQTQEGAAPYIETVEYLKTKEKINTLIPSKALCEIAQEIADNLVDSETGEIDEELHEQIIDKHGSFSGKFTRAMDFGGFTSEQVVINFLVCDGDVDRTQREPLLGEGLKKIGVAFGKHNIYRTICVLVTCSEFNNTKDPDDLMVFRDPEEEKAEQERLEKEKIEQERLEKEKAEQERLEKEKAEKEKEEQKALDEEKEKEKKRIEEEKRIKEEAERKKKEEEKKKKEEAERKKKEEEEKKKKEPVKKKYEVTNNNKGETTNIFKLKKKIYAYETVPKDQLPEGVASMTKSDTIVIEGGKRYKKIIYNKVMLDGTKKTEEVKTCLDN